MNHQSSELTLSEAARTSRHETFQKSMPHPNEKTIVYIPWSKKHERVRKKQNFLIPAPTQSGRKKREPSKRLDPPLKNLLLLPVCLIKDVRARPRRENFNVNHFLLGTFRLKRENKSRGKQRTRASKKHRFSM